MAKRLFQGITSITGSTRSPLRRIGLPRNHSTPIKPIKAIPTKVNDENEVAAVPEPELEPQSPIVATTKENPSNEDLFTPIPKSPLQSQSNASQNSNQENIENSSQQTPVRRNKRKLSLSLTYTAEKRAKLRKIREESFKDHEHKEDSNTSNSSDLDVTIVPKVIDLSREEPEPDAPHPDPTPTTTESMISEILAGERPSELLQNYFADLFDDDNEWEVKEEETTEIAKEFEEIENSSKESEETSQVSFSPKLGTSTQKVSPKIVKSTPKSTPELKKTFSKPISYESIAKEVELKDLQKIVEEKRERVRKLSAHIKRTTRHRELIHIWKNAGKRAVTELADLCGNQYTTRDLIAQILNQLNIRYDLFGYNPITQDFD